MDRAIEILSLFPSSSLACACLITRLRLFSPRSLLGRRASRFSVLQHCVPRKTRLEYQASRSEKSDCVLLADSRLLLLRRNLKNVLCKPYLCFPSSWARIRRFVCTNVFPGVRPCCGDASTTHFRTHFTGSARWEKFFIDIL